MRDLTVGLLVFLTCSCQEKSSNQGGVSTASVIQDSYALRVPAEFEIAPPIPTNDEWLITFKDRNGFTPGWEAWIWRLTDIEVAPGIQVYARDHEEQQFLLTGCERFEVLTIDFRFSHIGDAGFWTSGHNVKRSPSGRYIVCLAQNPQQYFHGVQIDDGVKRSGWEVAFSEREVSWTKTDSE